MRKSKAAGFIFENHSIGSLILSFLFFFIFIEKDPIADIKIVCGRPGGSIVRIIGRCNLAHNGPNRVRGDRRGKILAVRKRVKWGMGTNEA